MPRGHPIWMGTSFRAPRSSQSCSRLICRGCRRTSRSSWTATDAGPARGSCRGSPGTAPASSRCATSSKRSARLGLEVLTLYAFSSRELEAPARRGQHAHEAAQASTCGGSSRRCSTQQHPVPRDRAHRRSSTRRCSGSCSGRSRPPRGNTGHALQHRAELRRARRDRRRLPALRRRTAAACAPRATSTKRRFGRYLYTAGPARPRPADPHQRRDARQQLPALADRLRRDLGDRHALARLPPERSFCRPSSTSRSASGATAVSVPREPMRLPRRRRLAKGASFEADPDRPSSGCPILFVVIKYLPPAVFLVLVLCCVAAWAPRSCTRWWSSCGMQLAALHGHAAGDGRRPTPSTIRGCRPLDVLCVAALLTSRSCHWRGPARRGVLPRRPRDRRDTDDRHDRGAAHGIILALLTRWRGDGARSHGAAVLGRVAVGRSGLRRGVAGGRHQLAPAISPGKTVEGLSARLVAGDAGRADRPGLVLHAAVVCATRSLWACCWAVAGCWGIWSSRC